MSDSNVGPSIIVVDGDSGRQAAIRARLEDAGARAFDMQWSGSMFETSSEEELPSIWDLALVHGTDQQNFKRHWKNPDKNIRRIIYFSGSGKHDAKIPVHSEKIIRAIPVTNPLTKDEAAQLVRAASELGYRPPLTIPPVGLPILCSLSALVGLYLGILAAADEAGLEPPAGFSFKVDNSILRSIGWSRLPRDVREQLYSEPDGLLSQRVAVRLPSWWTERLPVQSTAELTDGLEKELRLLAERSNADMQHVRALVDCLTQNPPKLPDLTLVEECYRVLSALPEL